MYLHFRCHSSIIFRYFMYDRVSWTTRTSCMLFQVFWNFACFRKRHLRPAQGRGRRIMADEANRLLEDRARQAEALEESCVFTQAEIKHTLHARARFEYLLKRRRSTAGVFVSYFKFETDLYEIWRMRQVWLSFKRYLFHEAVRDDNAEIGCGEAKWLNKRHISWVHDAQHSQPFSESPSATPRKRWFVVGVRNVLLLTWQLSPAFGNSLSCSAVQS